MIRAYTVVEEDATSVTYQYNSLCSYWLYLSATLFAVGYGIGYPGITFAGLALLVPYFVIIYFPALSDARKIKASIRQNPGQMKGSRWSLSNPLRITVQKSETG